MPSDQAATLDAAVDGALARWGSAPSLLLQILIETQGRLSWLPPRALSRVAAALSLPQAHVKGVASFYSLLSLSPAGRYRLLFADNIIEEMQGSRALMLE
ncbi:MAG: NAD(P)H-dependent oxidoreductase subunit E, partial [Methylocystis sp.]